MTVGDARHCHLQLCCGLYFLRFEGCGGCAGALTNTALHCKISLLAQASSTMPCISWQPTSKPLHVQGP